MLITSLKYETDIFQLHPSDPFRITLIITRCVERSHILRWFLNLW